MDSQNQHPIGLNAIVQNITKFAKGHSQLALLGAFDSPTAIRKNCQTGTRRENRSNRPTRDRWTPLIQCIEMPL
jgi:hypothetical protein